MFNIIAEAQLTNPLPAGYDSIPGLLKGILSIVMYIGVPVIGLILVYAGFKFLFARGNPDNIKTAVFNIKWVIIGIGLFLGAWALTVLIYLTIKNILNG